MHIGASKEKQARRKMEKKDKTFMTLLLLIFLSSLY